MAAAGVGGPNPIPFSPNKLIGTRPSGKTRPAPIMAADNKASSVESNTLSREIAETKKGFNPQSLNQEKSRLLAKHGQTKHLESLIDKAIDGLQSKNFGEIVHFSDEGRNYFAFVSESKDGNIKLKMYETKEILGKGSFGEVSKVSKIGNEKVYAKKVMGEAKKDGPTVVSVSRNLNDLWANGLPELDGHVPIMTPPKFTVVSDQVLKNNHTEAQGKSNRNFLLTDLYDNTLSKLIESGDFVEKHGKVLTKDMLFALKIFEDKGILHPDFKPGNVMSKGDRFVVIDCDELLDIPKMIISKRSAKRKETTEERNNALLDKLKLQFQEKGTPEYNDQTNLLKIDDSTTLAEVNQGAYARGRISWGMGLHEALTGARPEGIKKDRFDLVKTVVFPLKNEKFERLPPAIQNVLTLLIKGDTQFDIGKALMLVDSEFDPPEEGVSVLLQRLNSVETLADGNKEVMLNLVSEIAVLALETNDKEALETALGLAASCFPETDDMSADLLNSQKTLLERTDIPADFGAVLQRHINRGDFGEESKSRYSLGS